MTPEFAILFRAGFLALLVWWAERGLMRRAKRLGRR